jgi:hypothetical protein
VVLALVSSVLGCASTSELSVEDQIKEVPDAFERILNLRTEYLSRTDYLPRKTPYDDQPTLKQIYLKEYQEAFLRETHPDTSQWRLIHPILDSDENRASHYGWLAGANAGWDQFGIWLDESVAEWEKEVKAILESNQ